MMPKLILITKMNEESFIIGESQEMIVNIGKCEFS